MTSPADASTEPATIPTEKKLEMYRMMLDARLFEEKAHKLRCEIQDFLGDVIRRAEVFMTALNANRGAAVEQELQAQMQNLVGRTLDEFRHEGTAQLQD